MTATNKTRVVTLIALLLAASVERVTPEARLREDLNADSLDLFELVIDVEDAFNVVLPDSETEALQAPGTTVQAVLDLLTRNGVPV